MTKTRLYKPPEKAVFCYTEKNNKNKSLNGKLFKTKRL